MKTYKLLNMKAITNKQKSEIKNAEVEHHRIVKRLREENIDSFFLDEEYDCAIVGIGSVDRSIMYDEFETIHVAMRLFKDDFGYEGETDYPEPEDEDTWCDFYDQCAEDIYSLFPREYNVDYNGRWDGKIPPTLLTQL